MIDEIYSIIKIYNFCKFVVYPNKYYGKKADIAINII